MENKNNHVNDKQWRFADNHTVMFSYEGFKVQAMKQVAAAAVIFQIFFASLILAATGSDDTRFNIVSYAREFIGTPYRYGGTGVGGFDCSGFTAHVHARFGLTLPRSAPAQCLKGKKIPSAEAKPGDIACFKIDGVTVSHVGIYLGDNRFIHAPSTGHRVSIAETTNVYWKPRLAGFVTFIP